MDQAALMRLGILIGLAVSAGLVAFLAYALPVLKNKRQGYPLEAEIEAALLPLLYQAICGAFRVSELAMDEVGARLRGVDKKQIADALYDMLPEQVGRFPLAFVKSVITREKFAGLVQAAFLAFDHRFTQNQARYRRLFEDWRAKWEANGDLVTFYREDPSGTAATQPGWLQNGMTRG